MTTKRAVAFAICGAISALLAAPAANAADAERVERSGERTDEQTAERSGQRRGAVRGVAPEGELLYYQVTGARDSATGATVVHCTNLGGGSVTLYVDFYDFDGAFVCTTSDVVAFGETSTLASRGTAFFEEDGICDPAPVLSQGSLDIVASGSTALICAAQVVDPAAATPSYVTTLDLFRP